MSVSTDIMKYFVFTWPLKHNTPQKRNNTSIGDQERRVSMCGFPFYRFTASLKLWWKVLFKTFQKDFLECSFRIFWGWGVINTWALALELAGDYTHYNVLSHQKKGMTTATIWLSRWIKMQAHSFMDTLPKKYSNILTSSVLSFFAGHPPSTGCNM